MTKDKLIIEKLRDRIAESRTVLTSVLPDLKADSVGKVFVENEIKYITQLESELSTFQAGEEDGNSHIHYFVDGVCMYCGAKMDYINAC
jgi:hypothetical protein